MGGPNGSPGGRVHVIEARQLGIDGRLGLPQILKDIAAKQARELRVQQQLLKQSEQQSAQEQSA